MSDVLDPSPALHSDGPAASTAQGLADQLHLAAIAVNRTRMPMVVTDPRQADNPIVLANQAFLNLTGYAADEVLGRNCRFLQGPNTSPETLAEIRAAMGDERDLTVELLNYRKDGTAFWNQLYLSPIHDDDGRLIYYFASQDDVTEFRKVQVLEDTERRLLKEVDHRARNVLAVVNGIVRLTRADDAKVYSAAIQQRVQALAAAHTLLADAGWREVALDQIIRQQLDALGSGQILVEGPDVKVSAFVVQPLALVVHELLLNATLHGALAGPSGTLTVRWDQTPQPGGFELHWEETGAPSPPDPGRSGFGTMMLRGMIEKQLRGRIKQDWSETGLVVTIRVPGIVDGVPGPVEP